MILDTNTINGVKVRPMQAELFYTLIQASPKTVSYPDLHKAIYGQCVGPVSGVIRNQICYLRKHIAPMEIETIYGKGYALKEG